MELCGFLRWKGYYENRWRNEEELRAVLTQVDSGFECLKTCQPWGDDDSPATPEVCGGHRSCFEAEGTDQALV